MRILVAGAGGFIGGHLVKALRDQPGTSIVAVDIKPTEEWFQIFPDVESKRADLSLLQDTREVMKDVDVVYNLAADMGGMGFIENNKALCMMSVLINTHLLQAAREFGAQKYFFASSACVYAAHKQSSPDLPALKESDAYPAMPEDGYGWEKLFSERMCRHFREDFGLDTRVVRFHNVYGPHGTFDGGREKAPAALCRKVAEAKVGGGNEIEIWGSGEQTRSFTFIDDCIRGIEKLMSLPELVEPVNLGSSQKVTINQMLGIIESIAGVRLTRKYLLNAPQGVQGRSSDNTKIRELVGWEPDTPLEKGLVSTYGWIEQKIEANRASDGAGAL